MRYLKRTGYCVKGNFSRIHHALYWIALSLSVAVLVLIGIHTITVVFVVLLPVCLFLLVPPYQYQKKQLDRAQFELANLNKKLKEDMAKREIIEGALLESDELYRSLLRASPDAILLLDRTGLILMSSPMSACILGYTDPEDLIGRNILDFLQFDMSEQEQTSIMSRLVNDQIVTIEMIGCRADQSTFIMEIVCKAILKKEGSFTQIVSILRDVTDRRHIEDALRTSEDRYRQLSLQLENKNKQLSESLLIDPLTGIYNRQYFDKRIVEELETADRYGFPLSLIFFDLDHFKNVNDQFGHDAGDNVLVLLSETVRRFVRKSDVFARWGGEEFVILMTHTGIRGARAAAEKIRQATACMVFPDIGSVTISLGVVEHVQNEFVQSWFKRADHALYRAKQEGRNRVCISDADIHSTDIQLRLDWQSGWDCGNELIDSQHRKLLQMGNELIQLSLSGRRVNEMMQKLEAIISHVILHFSDEENLLRQIGYIHLADHQVMHQALIEKANQLQNKIINGTIKPSEAFGFIVSDIIAEHMLKEDVRYFSEVRSQQN